MADSTLLSPELIVGSKGIAAAQIINDAHAVITFLSGDCTSLSLASATSSALLCSNFNKAVYRFLS